MSALYYEYVWFMLLIPFQLLFSNIHVREESDIRDKKDVPLQTSLLSVGLWM